MFDRIKTISLEGKTEQTQLSLIDIHIPKALQSCCFFLTTQSVYIATADHANWFILLFID